MLAVVAVSAFTVFAAYPGFVDDGITLLLTMLFVMPELIAST